MTLATFLPVILVVHISSRSRCSRRACCCLLRRAASSPAASRARAALAAEPRHAGHRRGPGGHRSAACHWPSARSCSPSRGCSLALVLYAANLLLAFFVQRPGRRAPADAARRDLGRGKEARLRRWATRQRYISYVMAGLVGAIAFLMMTKPQL